LERKKKLVCVRFLKCFPGSLSEMAVLGVSQSVGIRGVLIFFSYIYSLNMVLAGKDPMCCLSGKLKFVAQIYYCSEADF
jgi:hypothetical protein